MRHCGGYILYFNLSLRDNAARVNASRNGHTLKKIVLLILLSILLGESYAAKMKRNAIVVKVKLYLNTIGT